MNFTSSELLRLPREDFYVTKNGKLIDDWATLKETDQFRVNLRVLGGKGGFGSLLRSFGSQFYKSTNQDMCRDLSGRRLKDVKQEERLKKYISKSAQREDEKQKRLDEKYKKLKSLDERKHTFNDQEYTKEKQRILDETEDALQQGLKALEEDSKAAAAAASASTGDQPGTSGTSTSSSVLGKRKRKSEEETSSGSSASDSLPQEKTKSTEAPVSKKPKGGMWLGIEGLNESDLDTSDEEDDNQEGASSSMKKDVVVKK